MSDKELLDFLGSFGFRKVERMSPLQNFAPFSNKRRSGVHQRMGPVGMDCYRSRPKYLYDPTEEELRRHFLEMLLPDGVQRTQPFVKSNL